MTDIRSFFGRSTIVKSSSPLNSKEKKVIKIDWRKLNVFFFFSFSIGFIAYCSFTEGVSNFFETNENTLQKMQSRI